MRANDGEQQLRQVHTAVCRKREKCPERAASPAATLFYTQPRGEPRSACGGGEGRVQGLYRA